MEEESVKDDELTLKATPNPDIFNQFDDCFLVTLSEGQNLLYSNTLLETQFTQQTNLLAPLETK